MWLPTTINFLSAVKKDCEHHLIVRAVESGTLKRTVTDTTLPTGPIRRKFSWHIPLIKCEREADHTTVWRKSEKKAPV